MDYLLPTDTTKDRIDVNVKEYTSNFENQRRNSHLSDSLDEHDVYSETEEDNPGSPYPLQIRPIRESITPSLPILLSL